MRRNWLLAGSALSAVTIFDLFSASRAFACGVGGHGHGSTGVRGEQLGPPARVPAATIEASYSPSNGVVFVGAAIVVIGYLIPSTPVMIVGVVVFAIGGYQSAAEVVNPLVNAIENFN